MIQAGFIKNIDFKMTQEERRAYDKDYYKKNSEKRKAVAKAWIVENREKYESQKKLYREKNKSKIKKRQKLYSEKNPEKCYFYVKTWRENNPESSKIIMINDNSKRRARTKQTDITTKYLLELKSKTSHCEICGKKLKDNIHLDHIIPLNVGGLHIKSNIRYVHAKCNLQRPKNGSDIIQFRLL